MDPGFRGCGCQLPNIRADQRDVDGTKEHVMVCQNHGCGAVWQQVGRSYVMIESPADPDRAGVLKPPVMMTSRSATEDNADVKNEVEAVDQDKPSKDEDSGDLRTKTMAALATLAMREGLIWPNTTHRIHVVTAPIGWRWPKFPASSAV